jgi:peptidoglycan/xylan/chitin deacetylase (PgdA/CDA1 family)
MKFSGYAPALFALALLAGLQPGSFWHSAAQVIPAAGRPAPPAPLPPLADRLHGSIRSVRTGEKVVALTFDLCEGGREVAGYDAGVVDYLRTHRVKATFFAGGKWLQSHPEQALQLLAEPGFEIGNHSWSHRNLRQLTGQALADEVVPAQELLTALRQRLPVAAAHDQSSGAPALFRFPYGTCSPEALAWVNAHGLAAIQWDVVSGDPDPNIDAARMTEAVVGQAQPGSIIIMHINGRGWRTAEALPEIIRQLKERGFEFVTVSELLGLGEVSGP